ncbi:MAG TPA: deoxyguanosinetriphosphate triphosphohydrolase, partial [Candidatus Brocadiales bacterium]|nr:deoxyguanosinetriphosphate triphosphohydrolase [Candidatus Brocadiales bacterium]
RRFVEELFKAFVANPRQLPPDFQAWAEKEGIHRGVCDYIAGMTDRYAQDEYLRLFHPYERV